MSHKVVAAFEVAPQLCCEWLSQKSSAIDAVLLDLVVDHSFSDLKQFGCASLIAFCSLQSIDDHLSLKRNHGAHQ